MRIFRNRHDNLRVVWRIIIYLLLGVIVFIPLIPILKVLPLDKTNKGPDSVVNLVFVLFLDIGFLVAGWIALRWIDRRPPALLGLNFWFSSLKELGVGVSIGLLNLVVIYLVLLTFGWVSVEWSGVSPAEAMTFLSSFATFFVFASFEELLNRGYPFQVLCEGVGTLAAAIIISLIFSLGHLANESFSILGAVFLCVHGLLYTVAYLRTRSLWTPIGLHVAWNFAQGPLAGMKVSGTTACIKLLSTQTTGPDLATGGGFGVEGGLVAILVSIAVLILLFKARWLRPSARYIRIERDWKSRQNQGQAPSRLDLRD